ncbi:ZnF_CDGSH domain-containing protein [Durusdinium trenchii]|uniref:ZnF_CDGSH domain-containing protein n=1 Tax=Durusdinium trenchii TaxID=1381693 RepID=A0ABP0PBT8_9DINO
MVQELLRIVDEVMFQAADFVQMFIFDGETCHQIIRSAVHGDANLAIKRQLMETKFFSKIRYRPIEGLESLPRIPLKIAFVDGHPLWALPGPAHALKNAAAQLCAEGKVLQFGLYFADASGALSGGLLRTCAKYALASALHLVSECSGISKNVLTQMYQNECVNDFFEDEDEECPDESLEEAMQQEAQAICDAASEQDMEKVLGHISEVAAEEFASEDRFEEADPAECKDLDEMLPDGVQLLDLTHESKDSSEAKEISGKADFPKTLREAVASPNMWAGLWQLAVQLRCGENGMDAKFLKAAEVVRKRSRKLNWHQSLEMDLKEIRMQEDGMLAGQRGMGQVVLLNMGMKSEPAAGVVLTLFPVGKKPKPCAQRIPLTHVKSFRATILEEREFGDDVMLVPSTNTWRYSQEHVLAILDVKDETDLAQGKIFLTPESWQVLERLRLSQSYLTRRTRSEGRNP